MTLAVDSQQQTKQRGKNSSFAMAIGVRNSKTDKRSACGTFVLLDHSTSTNKHLYIAAKQC